jgi:transposase InsO family protein
VKASPSLYYTWSKEFLGLASGALRDTARAATSGEVKDLRREDHDLMASRAYIVMKAADEFKDKTTAPNQLWQTDSRSSGWGWFYLSTILDDFYIIAWKLCTTMKVGEVTETLDLALQASGLDRGRPRRMVGQTQTRLNPKSPLAIPKERRIKSAVR